MGGHVDDETVDRVGGGGTRYKCVYPMGGSGCYEYSTTPYCGKDSSGAQGTLTRC